MRKVLFFAFCILLFPFTLNARIVVHSSTERALVVRVSLPDMQFFEKQYRDGNIYTKIIVPGSARLAVGMPDVPSFGAWILIPNGTSVSISSFIGTPKVYENVNLPPVQPLPMDQKDAPAPPFTKDATTFSTDADYPGMPAETEPIKRKRGQDCTILWIYPYQYNPVRKTLRVYRDLEITVNFSGIIQPIPANLRNENLEKSLKSMAINGEAVISAEKSAGSEWPQNKQEIEGYELLIITHPNFEDAAVALADWKTRRGINAKVVTTDTTGNSNSEIEAYIDSVYVNWNPAPSYLLFIGDSEFIPTWHVNMHPRGDGHTGADIFYADYDNPADYVAEFGYARLSVDTDEEADSLIARVIRYERSPVNFNSYYTHSTMACCFQDGQYGPPDSIADRRFAKTSEDVKNFLDTQGYTQERIYITANLYNSDPVYPKYWSTDFVFENDSSGVEIPWYLQKPTFPWDGDAGDITAAVNNGRFFITHRDHGARDGWADPEFDNADVDALNNGERRPFVWTVNCQTGWFDNETDDAGYGTGYADECFVEHWLRHNIGGSCGLIGSTRNSYSGINDRLVWGWMDAIWPTFLTWCNDPYGSADPIYRMGDVHNYGKEYMRTKYAWDSYVRTGVEEFHWFGDPTTEMWTQIPGDLTVSHTDSCFYGTSYCTVYVDQDDALVSLVQNGEIIGTAISGGGSAVVSCEPPVSGPGDVYVTVTKHDYRPYEGIIIPVFCGIVYDGHGGPLRAGSYTVMCDVEIPVGETLTIEPGTHVAFKQNCKLIANGILNANGELGDPIYLVSEDSDKGMKLNCEFTLANGEEYKPGQ